MVTEPPASGPGRKRDPRIEERATRGAIEVYAEYGWKGFTFDAVAHAANVGKPALYRRWSSREALLVDSFDRLDFPVAHDCGSLRADLADYIDQYVRWFHTPYLPEVGIRVLVDYANNAELYRLYTARITVPRGHAVREVTRRAIARGELPAGTPPSLMADLVLGALHIHWAYSANKGSAAFLAGLRDYADRLVETIIAGLMHAAPVPGTRRRRRRAT